MIEKITIQPVIKWSGSKRSQAFNIINLFPKEIDTFYEPFCGGASILYALLNQQDFKINNYVCNDINKDLINLWNVIKNNPKELIDHYTILWTELNSYSNLDDKKNYFYKIRDRYNKEHNPFDFFFIMRTTTNGMPRYNNEGLFNNSFHITRNGIQPKTIEKIIFDWSEILNKKNVTFISKDYLELKPNEYDFCYFDPPYSNSKMYYGCIDYNVFFDYLSKLKCKYALSFNGKGKDFDLTYQIPKDLYLQHFLLKSGNSSFRRIIGNDKNNIIYENLYLNY